MRSDNFLTRENSYLLFLRESGAFDTIERRRLT
jgi:hypothetical protein